MNRALLAALALVLAAPVRAAAPVCDERAAEFATTSECWSLGPDKNDCAELRDKVRELEAACLAEAARLAAHSRSSEKDLRVNGDNLERLLLTSKIGSYGYHARFPESVLYAVREAQEEARKKAADEAVKASGVSYCRLGVVRQSEPVLCNGHTPGECADSLRGMENACLHALEFGRERLRQAMVGEAAPPVDVFTSVLDNAQALFEAASRRPGYAPSMRPALIANELASARALVKPAAPVAAPAGTIAAPIALAHDGLAPLLGAASAPVASPKRSSAMPWIIAVLLFFGGSAVLFAKSRTVEAAAKRDESLPYVPSRPARPQIGETLADAGAARGPFEPAFIRAKVAQACALLAPLHARGQSHGCVSPATLLLTPDAALELLPYGAALNGSGLESAPPENERSPRGDLYGVACTAYFLLGGETPFHGADGDARKAVADFVSITNRRPGLPLALDLFFTRALSVEPARRIASTKEFLEEFNRALGAKS